MLRPDQIERLQELGRKLADVFLVDADPGNWSGGDVLPKDMDAAQRGNRHWDKKNAVGTGTVLAHAMNVLKAHTTPTAGNEKPPEDMDEALRDAERRATKAVNDAVARAKGKPEFDKRVHGNAKG